jgi:hypothetical protein
MIEVVAPPAPRLYASPTPVEAPESERPAPMIAGTLLLPQDRIAREPLSCWASRLTADLGRERRAEWPPREQAAVLGGIANNAALIAAHHGYPARARAICEAQVRCHLRRAVDTGDAAISGHALQPWINLGRLDAIAGEWEVALARFASLAGARAGAPIRLGTVQTDGVGWQVIGDTPNQFAEFVERVRIVESLKALLANRRWAEVLAFAEEIPPELGTGTARLVREARIVALVQAGWHVEAEESARDGLRDSAGWEQMVFQLRLAEVIAMAGSIARAAGLLRPVLRAGLGLPAATCGMLQPLYVLTRAAAAAHEVGMYEEAACLARRLLEGARFARDEIFELGCLRLLAAAARANERPGWKEALDRLRSETEYVRERGAVDRPSGPVEGAAARLYASLLERLEC